MEGVKVTPSRIVFAAISTILLVLLLMYLKIAFEGSDVKTAIRLVEEAKIEGQTLGTKIAGVLPAQQRYCEAVSMNQFHGHMEVTCSSTAKASHILRWRVNVLDGMVVPANEASKRLGQGENPWLEK